MKRFSGLAIGALAVSAFAGFACGQCTQSAENTQHAKVVSASYRNHDQAGDIVETAMAAGNFKTLTAALKAAGWVDQLKGKGPFTVFAPTDEAFAKLPKGTVEMLLKPENKAKLADILTYHVVSGNQTADKVMKMSSAMTIEGQRVAITSKDGKVWLNNSAEVITPDIKASNGTIHVIDTVLMSADKDIVQTASEAGSFNTLLAALDAAGWKEPLMGKGPFTVFAPSDAAFAKLPAGTVEMLLKPENKEKLASILKFHVIAGRIYADQAMKMHESEKTLEGSKFHIKVKDGKVWIGNDKAWAQITATDMDTSNGVIHVIDTVLMPD